MAEIINQDIDFVDPEILILDVENKDKARLVQCLSTYRKLPFFMFGDKFLFSINCKTFPNETECRIIEDSLVKCAKKLREYYEYEGIEID